MEEKNPFENAKIGWGILFHGNTWVSKKIQEISKSYWNHVTVYLGEHKILRSPEIREAIWKGVRRTSLRSYLKDGDEALVFSVRGATDENHVRIALRSGDFSNLDYGYGQILLIYLVWRYGTKHLWIRDILYIWNKFVRRIICSELYGAASTKEGFELTPGVHLAEVMPKHFDPEVNPLVKEEFRVQN